ncbi:hydrolase 2, exosortase A system-associated [Rugamonas sp. CCM 8940]|uniref:hydrolase 2, exosortase A system-associated n=1 Tax=Rugamonas sp. CCM 8940 TaxID=2765359 RepID=UPI0018F46E8B|nr:hydrolase 2, exosortase A system-associated [Rugamonas sp. CCM 8940]MBJ7312461.1 hydrolase 2, exosortase A system-associated [Rugamonas sp. CCM 8940]
MTQSAAAPGALPFFLPAEAGERFCLYHAPAGRCRGAVLYLHPWGEEMNKARRMAALQSRALAQLGYGVLQLDLYGCGDSAGDAADARWEIWLADVANGATWLRQRLDQPLTLWGLRLGALLALDYARAAPGVAQRLLLWQTPANGATLLTQFLRLRMAGQLLAEGAAEDNSTAALRRQLADGATLEIAGYALAPALAASIDALDAAALTVTGCPVHWLEVAPRGDGQLTPASARITQAWRDKGVDLHCHPLVGAQFWATQEISENPALLDTSCAILA